MDDAAGVDDALDAGGGVLGDVVLEDQRALGARLAGDLDLVLDGHGQALEGARPAAAARVAGLGPPRPLEGLVEEADGQRVDLVVDRLDAVDRRLHELDRGELAGAEQRQRLARRQVVQILRHEILLLTIGMPVSSCAIASLSVGSVPAVLRVTGRPQCTTQAWCA